MTLSIPHTQLPVSKFKLKFLKFLQARRLFLDNHTDHSQVLSSTMLGWYCSKFHPAVTTEEYAADKINNALCTQFDTAPDKYSAFIPTSTSPWDPDTGFPLVTTKFQRLKWNKEKHEGYYAQALSVYGNSQYKVFLKHLLIDSDALTSRTEGRVTFVDQSMKVGVPNVQAQYGKVIFQQQHFV